MGIANSLGIYLLGCVHCSIEIKDIVINFKTFIKTAKGVLIPKYIIAFCFSFIPVILDYRRCQILIYLAQWWSVSTVQPRPQVSWVING